MTMNNLMTQIAISISEVMETMFYIPVEPRDSYTTIGKSGLFTDRAAVSSPYNPVITPEKIKSAIITFHGIAFSGTIGLIVPENLLMIMTENFMGENRQHLSVDHLEGTLKEALNMLAGNTFSKIDDKSSFGLGVPEINTAEVLNRIKESGEYSNTPLLVVETMNGRIGIAADVEQN